MTRKRLFSFLLFFTLLIILVAAVAQTQVQRPKANFVDRISAVLEKAGCPLSQRQLDAIAKITPGPDARGAMQKILSDDQKKALQSALKQQRTGLQLRGMAQRLKAAGIPLTDDQIAKIKALKLGEGKGALQSILTADQVNALKKGAGLKRERLVIGGIAVQLKKAGYPLSVRQIAQIKNLVKGAKSRDALMNILTAEQKVALKKPFVDRLAARLKAAGQPLSDEQLKSINAIMPGKNAREQVKAILTSEQVSALKKSISEAAPSTGTTDKATAAGETPRVFNALKPNYPNPFNPSTTIEYSIVQPGNVRVQIFGINGQLISTLVDSYQAAGWHSATWNAGNLAGGMYICTVTSGGFTQSRKMTLLK
ncbi:MAG: T9SS type A sorting domain-containing protein [Candidatus Latescibacter sp.]|nr:T9SS type A sorting domain-containing protein [Candidatus Latescibacter sp.]